MGESVICGDGMCPYVPCSKFPKCNHLEKQMEFEKKQRDKWQDKEYCITAVKQDGKSLQFVPEKYKTEKLCLEAVKQDGWALKYVPEKHKAKCIRALR